MRERDPGERIGAAAGDGGPGSGRREFARVIGARRLWALPVVVLLPAVRREGGRGWGGLRSKPVTVAAVRGGGPGRAGGAALL